MIELPFGRDEYARRLGHVRAEMQRRGLELLIVNDVANQHYMTGYDGWSFYTPQVVLVPLEEVEPVWIGRAMDAAGGLLTAWMKPENVVGFPEDHVQRADRHPMDWIASWIVAKGWGNRHIGIELEAYYFSPKAHARLVAGLPNAKWHDADLLVNWIRAVKSAPEIAYLRKASTLAEAAVARGLRGDRAGRARVRRHRPHPGGADRRQPGFRRRHHRSAADHPRRRERLGAAHHVERPAVRRQRDDRAGTCRRLPPLCRRAGQNDAARQDADACRGHGKGGDRGHGRGARCGQAGNDRRSGRGGMAQGHPALRAEEGIAHRLFHRRRLSAGLGRAHDQPAARRQDGAATRQRRSFHPRHVDGRLGHRGQRDHPGDRNRQ